MQGPVYMQNATTEPRQPVLHPGGLYPSWITRRVPERITAPAQPPVWPMSTGGHEDESPTGYVSASCVEQLQLEDILCVGPRREIAAV